MLAVILLFWATHFVGDRRGVQRRRDRPPPDGLGAEPGALSFDVEERLPQERRLKGDATHPAANADRAFPIPQGLKGRSVGGNSRREQRRAFFQDAGRHGGAPRGQDNPVDLRRQDEARPLKIPLGGTGFLGLPVRKRPAGPRVDFEGPENALQIVGGDGPRGHRIDLGQQGVHVVPPPRRREFFPGAAQGFVPGRQGGQPPHQRSEVEPRSADDDRRRPAAGQVRQNDRSLLDKTSGGERFRGIGHVHQMVRHPGRHVAPPRGRVPPFALRLRGPGRQTPVHLARVGRDDFRPEGAGEGQGHGALANARGPHQDPNRLPAGPPGVGEHQ